ncbi:MAG: hypothetical protein JW934_22680 [Anaerolineae bacterium]|nr:hypothetical protein [Anaerolineae bacterium]
MAKLKSILGYLLASLSVPIVLATFMGMSFWSELLVDATGVTVSPWFTGGEVAYAVEHGAYHTDIHHPVFDALIGQRREGFVQVSWISAGVLPAQIDEELDLDGDGQADARVQLDTKAPRATLTSLSPWVLELEGTYTLNDGVAVRIQLENRK